MYRRPQRLVKDVPVAQVQHLVEAAGGTMNDIVKMTGFVTDISQREDYLRARRDFFTADPPGLHAR